MKKHIVVFDVETTGLDFSTDRIVQLSAVKVDEHLDELATFSEFICPSGTWSMSPGACALTNYTEEFIKSVGKPMSIVGPAFLTFISDCDLCGYNSNGYDVKMLFNDLAREGLELDVTDRVCYDVYSIERHLRPSKLPDVFQRYTGKTMEEFGLSAHEALSDVKATVEILKYQTGLVGGLQELSTWPENNLTVADGTVEYKDGKLLMKTGKYKTHDVYEISKTDRNYLRWWAQNVLSRASYKVVHAYLTECYSDNINKSK